MRWDRALHAHRAYLFEAVAAVYAAAYVVWNVAHVPGTPVNDAIADWAFYPLGFVVGLLCARNALVGGSAGLDRRTRVAWWLLAGSAFLLWGSGTAWSYYVSLTGPKATPTWIDQSELVQLALTIAAMLVFPSRWPGPHARTRFWLDLALLLVAATAAAGVYGAGAIAPVSRSNWTVWLRAAVDWAVFLSLSVAVLYKRDRPVRGAAAFLLAANVSVLSANWLLPLLPEYRSGNAVDLLWFAAWVLKAAAARYAWHRYRTKPTSNDATPSWSVSALPHAIVTAGFVLLVYRVLTTPSDVGTFVYAASAMIGLLALRQVAELRERRRLFDRRTAQESRFRSLVQNASDVTLIVDDAGVVSYVSPSAARVLGPGVIEAGTRLPDVLSPDARPEFAALSSVPNVVAKRLACAMKSANGGWREVEMLATDMRLDPTVRGIVLNCRDVTDRNEFERRLQHAQKLDALGRLAGGLAHDFNNVLTSVRGEAELLLRQVPAGSSTAADLEGITQAVDRAATVTGKLLSFSRRQPVQRVTLDLGRVILELGPLLRQAVGPLVDLEIAVAPALWPIRADKGQMEQVVINLATNARDAMPEGGILRIHAANCTVRDSSSLPPVPPGEYARLTVTDTGHGMPESIRRRVFEPFFSTKSADKGTGLGLAMVHGIVMHSSGHVWLESVEGQGTTCTVMLPRSSESVRVSGSQAVVAAGRSATGRRVLLVDDESAVRRVARLMLERAGYDVTEAGSGHEALAAIAGGLQADVLLTDLVMPGMNGPELARRVLAIRPETVVVCITGFAGAREGAGWDTASWPVVTKPFAAETLARTVAGAIAAAERAR